MYRHVLVVQYVMYGNQYSQGNELKDTSQLTCFPFSVREIPDETPSHSPIQAIHTCNIVSRLSSMPVDGDAR